MSSRSSRQRRLFKHLQHRGLGGRLQDAPGREFLRLRVRRPPDAIGRIGKLGKLTPRGIRTHLDLNKPIYSVTAAYGHFGRKAEGDLFPWERLDLVDDLKAALAA